MRIIGGKFKGKVIKLPKDLPVRPTTDFAKEALFNIINPKRPFIIIVLKPISFKIYLN